LQRRLAALGIECHVVCPQKLDEQKRIKTDGVLKLERVLPSNRHALALVRGPTEEEEQTRVLHRQREQLVKVREVLEAQERSLMVNHGIEPVQQQWWKRRSFSALSVPQWIKDLLGNTQPIVLAAHRARIAAEDRSAHAAIVKRRHYRTLSRAWQNDQRHHRPGNRQLASVYQTPPDRQLHRVCPGEYSSGNKRLPSCVTKHGNPRLRAALVELAWRMVRF